MRINRHHGVEYFHGFIFNMDWCREILRYERLDWFIVCVEVKLLLYEVIEGGSEKLS